jgi:phosphoribosylformylglycinamidine (FGAM) synthase-like amidotransferase family enzyme
MIRALVLRAPGINRDEDAAAAIELAGGAAARIHINRIVDGGVRLATTWARASCSPSIWCTACRNSSPPLSPMVAR